MGAFDSIEAEVPCPQCGDIFYLHGTQTKFFEPEYEDQRWMRPGETHPLDAMPDLERSEWLRVRDPIDPDRFTLLIDSDEMFRCECDCACAPLFHFVHTPGHITLERVEILDVRDAIAHLVDFTDSIVLWTGAWDTFHEAQRAFASKPFVERAAQLHARLAARFDYHHEIAPWTMLVGPTRCEACGDTRERTHRTLLTHSDPTVGSFFPPSWRGGAIMLGDRVPFDEAHATGRAVRLRIPGETITILGYRGWFGCGCGAGRVRYVARFDRRDGDLVLVDLAVRASDDTSDADYVEQ